MFRTICDMIPVDRDLPARARDLDILQRILDNQLYDVLPYEFHQERMEGGEYIPLRLRRPSVRYALARVVVAGNTAQCGDDRGGIAPQCRVRSDTVARVAATAISTGYADGVSDAGLGSGGAGHADCGNGAFQGEWRCTGFAGLRGCRCGCAVLVRAAMGCHMGDVV